MAEETVPPSAPAAPRPLVGLPTDSHDQERARNGCIGLMALRVAAPAGAGLDDLLFDALNLAGCAGAALDMLANELAGTPHQADVWPSVYLLRQARAALEAAQVTHDQAVRSGYSFQGVRW